MAKPNYAFEKRQREIAKKKEKDAKLSRKRVTREERSGAGNVVTERGGEQAPGASGEGSGG